MTNLEAALAAVAVGAVVYFVADTIANPAPTRGQIDPSTGGVALAPGETYGPPAPNLGIDNSIHDAFVIN